MEIYKADNARMHHHNVMRVDTAHCSSDELAGRISASELFPRQNTQFSGRRPCRSLYRGGFFQRVDANTAPSAFFTAVGYRHNQCCIRSLPSVYEPCHPFHGCFFPGNHHGGITGEGRKHCRFNGISRDSKHLGDLVFSINMVCLSSIIFNIRPLRIVFKKRCSRRIM